MDFDLFSSGEMTLRLTSADIPGALLAMENNNITICNVEMIDPLTIRFRVEKRNWNIAQAIFQHRGDTLRMEGEYGFSSLCRRIVKRPVLLIGMLLLFILSVWAPGRIFFIQVEGNDQIPSNQILEQADFCGIQFGASRREVRSEKMKNALLERMPQLQWAGINTYGCVAVISVTERMDTSPEPECFGVSSIVAATDAVVREITVTGGTQRCSVGQAVKAGDVLISGYSDCGICIRATDAKGEVYGESQRTMTAVFPMGYTARGKITSVVKKYSLIIGKKQINFSNNSGILDGECVRIYLEKYITLPGGFQLPVAFIEEQYIFYEREAVVYQDPECVLQSYIENYWQTHMIAGKVLSVSEVVTKTDELYRIDGVYGCYEMIGILRPEECLPQYEND